jgi:hypothetical protein
VSNFDPEFTAQKPVLTVMQHSLSPDEQDLFKEFEYISQWATDERTKVLQA